MCFNMSGDRESKYKADLCKAMALLCLTPFGLFLKELYDMPIGNHLLRVFVHGFYCLIAFVIAAFYIRKGGMILRKEDLRG